MEKDERVPPVPKELTIRIRPDHYLKLATEAVQQGNGSRAIENYLKYIANLSNPDDMKLNEQVDMTKLIVALNSPTDEPDFRLQEEIIKCYLSVLNIYPENAILSNALGVLLFSHGEYNAARKFLKIAASVGYLPGEKNYLHVIWHLMPRWHFRMLNDKHRNQSYRNAIKRAVKSGLKNVYDIGTGAGLLTLLALHSGEDVQVVAFEENKTLGEVATKVFKLNKVTERVKLITANSRKFDEPPGPCDLIVTEIFDAGVFGEDCIDTLIHALQHFRKCKPWRIIPEAVKVFVTGLESVEVAKKSRVMNTLSELPLPGCILDCDKEPYDSDFLKSRKDVKFLTETREFLSVSFYDLEQLVQLKTNSNCIPEVELRCVKSGSLHSFSVWFDLHLDSNSVISTHPGNQKNQCWEQAIFNLDHPLEVSEGDSIRIKPRIVEGRFSFEVVHPESSCSDCIKVSKEVISFLNDSALTKSITEASEWYNHCDCLKVVDFNVFPLFGFLLAKKGATVFSVYRDESDLNLFSYLATKNGLHQDKMVFIHEKTVEKYMIYMSPPDIVFRDMIHSDSWADKEFAFQTDVAISAILPSKVRINVQLVSCDFLDFCNKVHDGNTLGFKLGEVMNEYTGTEHPNFEILDPEGLCSTIVTFDISDLDMIAFNGEGRATKDADCNGILYWFDVQITTESNRFDSLHSNYYDNSCTLLKTPKRVKKNDVITFHVMRFESHVKVYCD